MITETPFGELYGVDITKYTLESIGGLKVSLINYGATITNIIFDGKDVALGYDNLEDYLKSDGYLGATIGRFGNRIAGGKFTIGGKNYELGCNENGVNHLHGGFVGFDKQLWDVVAGEDCDEPWLAFNHVFDDMEEGYPGELDVTVRFTVTAHNSLKIEYKAISSKDTIVNFTNHTYFNLNGFDGGNILGHELYINADTFTPVDENLIPTGEIKDVADTPFDFRTAKTIGRDIAADCPQIALGHGYDHNFCLSGDNDTVKALVIGDKSKNKMSVKTSEPGVQLYTSNMLSNILGKGGGLYKNQGFCLETQHFPDSPNHANFPSTLLPAETDFYSFTEYIFSK